MSEKFEVITDEFPKLLANAIITLHQLPIPYSSIEKIIAEAMEQEAMYRFHDVEATTKTDERLINLIKSWSQEVSKLTGKSWVLEGIKIEKHEK